MLLVVILPILTTWRRGSVIRIFYKLTTLVLVSLLVGITCVAPAQARPGPTPVPIPYLVIPADTAPESLSGVFAQLAPGDNFISLDGAQWLQLQFTDFQLGDYGTLTIRDATNESQIFTQNQLEAWEGVTGIFKGSQLTVSLASGKNNTATLEEIIIGLPTQTDPSDSSAPFIPQSLLNILGEDPRQYISRDLLRQPDLVRQPENLVRQPENFDEIQAICEAGDERVSSTDPRVGRIMKVGCTGWIIQDGRLLTAGHCITPSAQTIEFNVPRSKVDGTPVPSAKRDEYRIIKESIVSQNTSSGDDWAVFRVEPNSETGLTPIEAQGGAFQISNTLKPSRVRVTGYGSDGPAPDFGKGVFSPKNDDNLTQQTHVGEVILSTNGDSTNTNNENEELTYRVDTQGANSGSPLIAEGINNVAIGIHTAGGCQQTRFNKTNAGTSFRNNKALWDEIRPQP